MQSCDLEMIHYPFEPSGHLPIFPAKGISVEHSRIGPFQVGKLLGRNRRQRVYQATHLEQGKEVVLKFITIPSNADRQEALAKIHRETEVLKQLRHPHLARVFGAGTEGNHIFFVYEFVAGESLASLLIRRGRLASDQAVMFGRQIASVLEYLEENELVHSILTPEKILVQDSQTVKLSGLRLNRSKRRRWDSVRKYDLETAAYLAPEALIGHPPTAKHDLYSLGVILYEMLTGHMPFDLDNIARLVKTKQTLTPPVVSEHLLNCPFWLDKVVSQLLQPDIRLRIHSAKAVVLALDQVQRIDQAQQSAAEQMVGGFNPLNAGVDKSEARRALGDSDQTVRKTSQPIFHSTAFIVVALIAISAIFAYALKPVPSQKLMDQAKLLLLSDQASDWQEARNHLEKIMDRRNAGDLAIEAEELYHGSRRRSLIHRVERGLSGLETDEVKQFGEAYALEQDEEYQQAIDAYTLLKVGLDPEGKHRFVYEECEERIEALIKLKELREREAAERQARFDDALERADRLLKSGRTSEALREYRGILDEFSDDPHFEALIERLKQRLSEIEELD